MWSRDENGMRETQNSGLGGFLSLEYVYQYDWSTWHWEKINIDALFRYQK